MAGLPAAPATSPQPTLEVRVQEGEIEVPGFGQDLTSFSMRILCGVARARRR